jgi:tetratricopeptide (TPR) repeat protein
VLITVVGAFALLAGGTTAYMGLRFFGIGPAASLITGGDIEENAVLVLADFVGVGEAAALARAVQEGVRAEFQQSRVVTLAGPGDLRPILALMEKPPDAPLDPATAREVAQRGGMPAVIEAEVIGTGEGYIFTASIVSPESGELLASRQVPTSADPDDIMAAIGRLSRGLREEIGESYRDLDQSKPLPEVTTQSLEALKRYADAAVDPDPDRRLALLEEAVAIDSTFAMAWRRIAVVLGQGYREPEGRMEALTKAYAYRNRLPDREKYFIEGDFLAEVEGDEERAIEAYQRRLDLFPGDRDFYDIAVRNNQALQYRGLRRNDAAERILVEAHGRHGPRVGVEVLILAQLDQGKVNEAEGTLLRHFGDRLGEPDFRGVRTNIALARGDYSAAAGEFRGLLEQSDDGVNDTGERGAALRGLMAVSAVRGRLHEAEAYARDLMATRLEKSLPGEYWWVPAELAQIQLFLRHDTSAALETLENTLSAFDAQGIDSQDRPDLLIWAAGAYADAGRVEKARGLLFQVESLGSPEVQSHPGAYSDLRGALALAEGRYADAVEEFRASDIGSCLLCALPGLARTYDAMGQADSALVAYERYVSTPYFYRLYLADQVFLGHALERLGQLYDQRGNREMAAEYYTRFVELWAQADPELQPRVEKARRRLGELGAGQ